MVLEQLTLARNKTTNQIAFRKAIFRLGRLMAHEFLRTLETQEFPVETPFGKTTGYKVKGNDRFSTILTLRSSIPFVDGCTRSLPMARTGIISAWRGEAPAFQIEINYSTRIPDIHPDDIVIIADPMLADRTHAIQGS